ncbi:lytic transglycosylase [Shewanella sp. BC20]|uniref:lytic murein transglycosylase n=1 Tax=Shewanella sp. BC20 TaxID=2004459 RepID=UPI000D64920E|nr:lytic murein transglycosylase [Shewanella sp. BC20]PWF64385.1 lytic transglycosylase [Shewanella sp. BC20]
MPKTLLKRVAACTLIFLPLISHSARGQDASFNDYLLKLKQEASAQGISQATINAAFPQIKRFKKANVAAAPSQSKTLETYLPEVVPEWKVDTARVLFNEHEVLLSNIADKYQVQPRFLVALWGLVSNFGDASGDYPVLSVMASLAFTDEDTARYQREFMAALSIMDKEHLKFEDLKSNDKGFMGQTQLLPSEYLAYGQDGDGDGKKDIWHNVADAFASAANLLKQQGWNGEDTWGRQVQAPVDLKAEFIGLNQSQTLAKWQQLGVRRFDNTDLPNREDIHASLIMPDGAKGRKYLVYGNYRALMHWQAVNYLGEGDYFGISVVHLSERIKTPQ